MKNQRICGHCMLYDDFGNGYTGNCCANMKTSRPPAHDKNLIEGKSITDSEVHQSQLDGVYWQDTCQMFFPTSARMRDFLFQKGKKYQPEVYKSLQQRTSIYSNLRIARNRSSLLFINLSDERTAMGCLLHGMK